MYWYIYTASSQIYLEFCLLRVMDHRMPPQAFLGVERNHLYLATICLARILEFTLKPYLHSKRFTTACKRADELTPFLMGGHNVVLKVEVCGVGFLTTLCGAFKHAPFTRVSPPFVLLQKPSMVEDPLALITWKGFCKQ